MGHTFKMVNDDNEAMYCKFHWKTDQGIKTFDRHQADEMAKQDPDYAIRDLYNSISNGNLPTWTMYIQVMTFEEAENWEFNPFDLTKVWPHADFPLIPVGKLTLFLETRRGHPTTSPTPSLAPMSTKSGPLIAIMFLATWHDGTLLMRITSHRLVYSTTRR